LDNSIGRISEEDLLIIGGDLNEHVGKDRNDFEEIMDGFRDLGTEMKMEFCQSRRLTVLNTLFNTGITIDLLQAAGMIGLRELTNIINGIIYGEKYRRLER